MSFHWSDSPLRYGLVTRVLHWGMATLLAWQFLGMGVKLTLGRHPLTAFLVGTHKPIGTALMLLILLRGVWGLAQWRRRPPHPATRAGRLASLGHALLYALMLYVPMVALLREFGSGRGFAPWGIPLLPATGERIVQLMAPANLSHGLVAWTLLALITVAVLVAGPPGTGAALEHQTDPAWARPATTVTSWSTREQWPTTAPRADAVTIAPAYGRSIHLQEYVDGRWQTRTTTRLDDVASQRLEVALPRQWTERPVSRWRLQLPATDEALAHTTPVKRVEARWEPSADPASLTALVTKADGVSPRTWAPRRLVRPDIATLGHNDRLRPLAAVALERLAAGARRATGRELVLASGYRSYAYQASLYHRYVGSDGAAATSDDRRPVRRPAR